MQIALTDLRLRGMAPAFCLQEPYIIHNTASDNSSDDRNQDKDDEAATPG